MKPLVDDIYDFSKGIAGTRVPTYMLPITENSSSLVVRKPLRFMAMILGYKNPETHIIAHWRD